MFYKIGQAVSQKSFVRLIIPDAITAELIMNQYTYTVYADYDVILKVDCNDKKHIHYECQKKRILIFLFNSKEDYSEIENLFIGYCSINFIIFQYEQVHIQNSISFFITKEFAQKYVEYLMYYFPQVISKDLDKKLLIEFCGYNLHNIYFLMQLCYYNQITIEHIKNHNLFLNSSDISISDDQDFMCILSMSTIGVHIKLAILMISKEKLSYYINKQYLFNNSDYIIPNINLQLHCKEYAHLNILKLWEHFDCYIKNLTDDSDYTIIGQTIWLLQKTIKLDKTDIEKISEIIFEIEGILHKIYRFTDNSRLFELEKLCKQLFEKNIEKSIYFLVNEAILYEDIEKYDVAKEKFLQALEMCDLVNIEEKVFVVDEFSRLLEKTGFHYQALKKLYFVEKYYQEKQNIKRLRNVRNRIGLNLCFVGNIKKGIAYLERLFWGDFEGKIQEDNVLSCEVANNLSIGYMESGNYNKALELQDDLYRIYMRVENAPINYATDILQNKGCVYLYKHEYKDATLCFEQALANEKNPVSKQLIWENYIYSKMLLENNFEDIQLFKDVSKQTADYETYKMLAELYFNGKFYKECIELCEKLLKEIVYEQNQIIYFSLYILLLKSRIMLKKFTFNHRVKAIIRLHKYKKYILKNIGNSSPYYEELKKCKKMIRSMK